MNGKDTGPIDTDGGNLSVRTANAAEKQNLPGTVWSVVHVDKKLKFKSAFLIKVGGPALAPDLFGVHIRIVGSDKREGDVARHSKWLLREHYRGK